eukprot:7297132-Lingulodinium_polyedra.AAC.1
MPGLEEGQLVFLMTEVYGLVSGTAWWRTSLLERFKAMGYRANPYDRCVLALDDEQGRVEGL